MTLEARVTALATAIGTDVKELFSAVAESKNTAVLMPMVAGDLPPSLIYSPEGELVYAQVED